MVAASTTAPSAPHSRHQARRGLAIFLAAVVLITGIFDVVMIITLNPLWIVPRMFAPALASVVARLVLREGFADVSFRFGGPLTWKYTGLALVFPTTIALVAYGTAWVTGIAQFDPNLQPGLAPSSPATSPPPLP